MVLELTMISWIWPQKHRQQKKIWYMGLYQAKQFLYIKGHKQSEKVVYEMGKKMSKSLYLLRGQYPE